MDSFETTYWAARKDVAIDDRVDAGLLRLTGRDRQELIQRLSTNDVTRLHAGEGLPTVLTSPTGRVLALVLTLADAETFYLRTDRQQTRDILRYLDNKIFFQDDVTVKDVSVDWAQYSLIGPQATALLARLAEQPALAAQPYQWVTLRVAGANVMAQRGGPLDVADWTLLAGQAEAAPVWAALSAAAPTLDGRAFEALRIEAGIPAWGAELSDQVTPLESGLSGAISYSKGCYTGQEVIARQTNYDKITRRLVGLHLPASQVDGIKGARVNAGSGRPGFVSSIAESPALGHPVALAVAPRDTANPGAEVVIASPTGEVRATVAELPLIARAA